MNIRVGSIDWTVKESEGTDDFGSTSYMDATIWVNPNQTDDLMKDTLVHELIHVLSFQYGIDMGTPEQEEAIIKTLAPALLDTLVRNPLLVERLLG